MLGRDTAPAQAGGRPDTQQWKICVCCEPVPGPRAGEAKGQPGPGGLSPGPCRPPLEAGDVGRSALIGPPQPQKGGVQPGSSRDFPAVCAVILAKEKAEPPPTQIARGRGSLGCQEGGWASALTSEHLPNSALEPGDCGDWGALGRRRCEQCRNLPAVQPALLLTMGHSLEEEGNVPRGLLQSNTCAAPGEGALETRQGPWRKTPLSPLSWGTSPVPGPPLQGCFEHPNSGTDKRSSPRALLSPLLGHLLPHSPCAAIQVTVPSAHTSEPNTRPLFQGRHRISGPGGKVTLIPTPS